IPVRLETKKNQDQSNRRDKALIDRSTVNNSQRDLTFEINSRKEIYTSGLKGAFGFHLFRWRPVRAAGRPNSAPSDPKIGGMQGSRSGLLFMLPASSIAPTGRHHFHVFRMLLPLPHWS
uniref:Glutamate receptor 2 n=1 Tax=Macrostomum lignano TaxID=282301 RepID=A0A1I8F4J6_9PLAT